ncbi:MAG: peptidyl-prolyl cis-trans isomerase [Bradymonadaceae bacterium]|nr:peptidyl-prolyl cis-trans isomerase [Lujinxingiaceae bacterium]
MIRPILGFAILCTLGVACAPEKPSEVEANVTRTKPGSSDEQGQAAVAIVNGEVITLGEFERRINGLAPFARARYATTERKQEYLANVVQFEVLADEAEKRGYGQDPAVLHAMKEVMVRQMLNDQLRERVSMREIDEAAVEQRYRANASEFAQPEQRRAAVIVLDSESEAASLRERFESREHDSREARVQDFRLLAHRHSTDRLTAENGGDAGLLRPNESEPARAQLSRVAFALAEVGELSEPYAIEGGWQLTMIIEKRPGQVRSLDEASREIRAQLFEEKRQAARGEFIEELMRSAKVETFHSALEKLESPPQALPQRFEKIPNLPVRNMPTAAPQGAD